VAGFGGGAEFQKKALNNYNLRDREDIADGSDANRKEKMG